MSRRAGLYEGLLLLWPGLRGLWRHGHFGGLTTAISFAAVLQAAVFTCLIWPDLVHSAATTVVCFCVALSWLFFAAVELANSRTLERFTADSVDREHLFQSAQSEYLKGNWFQAETLFLRLAQLDSHDIEARIYLASLNRHIDRIDEARAELEKLESIPAFRTWRWELERERQLLDQRALELTATTSSPPPAVDAA